MTVDILRWHRLLEPADIQFLDPSPQRNSRHRIIGMIGIDHKPDAVADGGADSARGPDIACNAKADFELYSAETLRAVLRRFIGKVVRRITILPAIEPGRICDDLVAHRTTHQPMRRLVEIFALEIPQRDVDAAKTLQDRSLLSVVAEPRIDIMPDELGAQGILSDQQRSQLADHTRVDTRRTVAFTPASQPLVCLDLHNKRMALRVPRPRISEGLRQRCFQHVRADIGDYHDGNIWLACLIRYSYYNMRNRRNYSQLFILTS